VTNTEQLVEAAEYASDNGIEWHEVFDSLPEASRVIKAAMKETAEEEQIVCLLSARNAYEDMFEFYTPSEVYKQELRKMKKELQEQ
jgi:hypothetical protein